MCARRCSFWRTVLPQNHAACEDPCCLLHPAQAETATQHVATRDAWSRNIPDSGLQVRQSQIIIAKRRATAAEIKRGGVADLVSPLPSYDFWYRVTVTVMSSV